MRQGPNAKFSQLERLARDRGKPPFSETAFGESSRANRLRKRFALLRFENENEERRTRTIG